MDSRRFRQILTLAAAFACFAATLALLFITEATAIRLEFAAAVTAVIASFIVFLSRRILFTGFVTLFLVSGICLVAHAKKMAMGMSLHSYDFLFYVNATTLEFLWGSYRPYVIAAIGFAALALTAGALTWHLDRLRCSRIVAGALTIGAVAASAWIGPQAVAVTRVNFMMNINVADYVSLFYMSWPSTFVMLTNGGVLAADAQTTLPNFSSPPVCVPSSKPPNIVLIHQESIFPLNIFPQIQYDHDLDRFFYSDDDQLHKMRVETFGGGSWITEFSVMSGISTRSFGDMGRFLHIFMRGHLHEALPQWLEKCGYRNVVFFPLDRTMFSLDKFYDSIGLHEVVDRDALKATDRERDRFFFDNAMVTMAQHFKSSDKPIFVYIQTMTAHGLWDQPFLPDEPVAKGGAGNSAEMNEYLRRVAIAAKDGEYFVDALKRRFPEERFLIVRFGDHQPELTRKFVNASTGTATKGTVDADRTPNAYLTYYSVLGVNYPVPPLPEYDVLDVAFLQTVLLDAAGLPLTPAQQERDRLMAVCAGQYFGCKQSDAIPAFHRRLINSGIVTP